MAPSARGTSEPPDRAARPPPASVHLVLDGAIDPSEVTQLCRRGRRVLATCGADPVVCDVAALGGAGAAEIDLLARLRLEARRLGVGLRLANASAELRDLVAFCGLDAVLRSAVEPRRQAEQREQALGIEEEADPGDPAA